MKKIITMILLLALALTLCACTQDPEQTTPQTTAAAETAETTAAEETTAADLKALANSCIDKSVDELIALIGEPNGSDYATSCLGNGEDGNLYYDGFTVYTYREGDTETVTFVE